MNNKTLTPLTDVQLLARKKKTLFYVVVWLACAVAAGILGFTFDSQFSKLLSMAGLFSLWALYSNGAFFLDSCKDLDGEGCLLLSGYADEHSEVKSFLTAVNGLGRSVVWDDLWAVNAWLVELQQEKMKKACLEINGVTRA